MSNAAALSSSATTYFAGNSTFTISTFSVTGSAGQYVVLKSTSSAQWYLNNTASNNASYVYVSSSNAQATGGKTIFCSNCVDGGNNLGWNFGTPATFTWTGAADTNFGNYANWDVGAVPRSIDNIVIPNTTNKCLLDQNRTINSVNVNAGGGVLDLNNFNLTVSTYVTLTGTMTAHGTEQVSVGGNWSASGGLFNYEQSTVTLTGVKPTILSAGTSFYNLESSVMGSTKTLSDAINVVNNFTQDTATRFKTNNFTMNVSSSLFAGGDFQAGGSTITVGANWDVSIGSFTYGSSLMIMNGIGSIFYDANRNYTTIGAYNLEISTAGHSTALVAAVGNPVFPFYILNKLIIDGGTVTGNVIIYQSSLLSHLSFTNGWN